MTKNDLIFFQLFEPESSTYTYLIGDKETNHAALIDPVKETFDRDLQFVNELGLKVVYVLDTHVHADHITSAGEIRKRTGAKIALSKEAGVSTADLALEDGQELPLGKKTIRVIATPGHTNSCLSFYFEGMVFTGDTLLIRGTGRTDFQQGSAEKLYESIHGKLFRLPKDTIVYPGHDYKGMTASTIELEMKFNPRLGGGKSKEDFIKIMAELKLAHPKKIAESVPANLVSGLVESNRAIQPQVVDGIPEVSVEEVHRQLDRLKLIDVRRPEEFNNELGHIKNSELATLGEQLTNWLKSGDRNQEIVFVCRSGARSGQAALEAEHLGYKKVGNMVGGMLRWNELGYAVEKG